MSRSLCTWLALCSFTIPRAALSAPAGTARLESRWLTVDVDTASGRWYLLDRRSGVRWPSAGRASPGAAAKPGGEFSVRDVGPRRVWLGTEGAVVMFELRDGGRALELRYETEGAGEIRTLGDALIVTPAQEGSVVVPCREGLLVPADSARTFRRTLGTSDYEGCHMNMLGFVKSGAALVVSWEDAHVFPELARSVSPATEAGGAQARHLVTTFSLRRSARALLLTPLGKGDWNTVASGYRRLAERKGLAITLREKIRRNARAERLLGAANVKLWTCLARRMNEESTREESVTVRWTFDEAARIAEHIHEDLRIERCLFMLGGWSEGGYDCRHPDNLPANSECGGNAGLADAVGRIEKLGFVACLHDNYQDMYRDAKSWDPAFIEKGRDGALVRGGRWLGGRAWMVCAPKQLELARRPQNLPGIHALFPVSSYFIDTTYAVGPRECHDPAHPIGRNEDIAWKIRLSDYARRVFGLFGSECGREWALPHSDFFEGLVGVSGRFYHNLDPAELGATPIPFWEMVYHDCQIAWGKYGYAADKAAAYVAHHVLCARPLHYHSIPDHLYWQEGNGVDRPAPASLPEEGCFLRSSGGWSEGMHPIDVFIKNTHEVLGPLHETTAHTLLERFGFLTPDRTVRRAVYGHGDEATVVVVNFGSSDVDVESRLGGTVNLPPWGFVVDGPRFAAFHATRWNGQDYSGGALFTIRALDDRRLDESPSVRVFHGFGGATIRWNGVVTRVPRERVVTSPPR